MKKQKSIPGLADHELEAQALSQLTAAKYKEAIRLFKKLLQTADNDEWHQKLAYCYVQRAIDFAAKGMYKEALVLWENHIQHAKPPYEAYDQYIIWLIQTNKLPSIEKNLAELTTEQLDKQYPQLAAVLGLLILAQHPEFQQSLPQDSVFIAHFNIAQAALQAYQDNNSERLNEALKQLPYRSAFRDFRTLLNASIAIQESAEQAQSLLAKIPANSPYFQAAKLLLACTKEGSELAEELIQLNHHQCNVIGEIKGLNKKQLDFIPHYSRQHDNLSDKVQFNLAIQYQSLLGTELARQFCQALLARYPAGNKDFNKHFGTVSEYEENRIKALNCEQDNNIYDAEYYWRNCLRYLNNEDTDANLKAALILRRLATRESDAEKQTDLLIESLGYNDSDRHSYLKIIEYYSQQAETAKEYKQWLTNTLKKFPQDVEVLTQAVKAATRNKTYKKACQYAAKILKIDPLNTFAKQTLFSSHLAHARRLMREKSYHLMEKEIAQAEKLNIGKAHHKQLQLMRALHCFASEDKQQGLQRISKELGILHTDPISMHFQATMEALLNGLPVTTILRELPPAKEHLLSPAELTVLIEQINRYVTDDEEQESLHKALEKIKAPLKKSLSAQDYPEELLLNLCQALDTIKHFELLRHCAKLAQLKFIKPIWMYYRVYADNNGDATNCSYMEVQRLQQANKQAMQDNDYQAGILIEKLLDSYYEAHPQRGMGFLDDMFAGFMGEEEDDDYEGEEPFEELFGHLDQGTMITLNNKAESIMKKATPEKLIQDLMKKAANKEAVIIAMMQNPDILSALILLKAADELKIDIEVDIDDVIEVFDISMDSNPFPFPF